MHQRSPAQRLRPFALALALVCATAACGSTDGGTAAEPTTTTAAETTTSTEAETTTTTEAETTTTTEADEEDMVGGKTILLDGFIGIAIPEGWSVTSSETPLLSDTSGSETELDPDALQQSLVVNPDDAPQGASFALVHYEHSDLVPSLDLFAEAVVELLSGDGSQIGEASEATIGGQDAYLHEVESASGASGVLVIFESGGELFFILTIVSDDTYSDDAAALLSSASFEPDALSA